MYLFITNKMQRYTMIFITINAVHVLGRSSKLYTQHRVFVELLLLLTAIVSELGLQSQLTQAVRSSKSSTNTRCCVYSFELLMMGEGTA